MAIPTNNPFNYIPEVTVLPNLESPTINVPDGTVVYYKPEGKHYVLVGGAWHVKEGGIAGAWGPGVATLDAYGQVDEPPKLRVPTIAALKALSPKPEQTVLVEAYAKPDDGGGGLFIWDDASTAEDDHGTIIAPQPVLATGRWKRMWSSGGLNVRWFGAQGDGETDDRISVIYTAKVAAKTGGAVYFPAGIYGVREPGILLDYSHVIYKGDNATIKALEQGMHMFQSHVDFAKDITLENLIIDSNDLALVGVTLYGMANVEIKIKDCTFVNFFNGIIASGGSNLTVEGCSFNGKGQGGNAITITDGFDTLIVRNSRFMWVYSGIVIATGNNRLTPNKNLMENLYVEGCYFDLGWWLIPYKYTNSGTTVSYTSNILTDTAADFLSLGLEDYDNIRIMPVLHTGTITAPPQNEISSPQRLHDSAASFDTYGIKRGDVVTVNNTHFAAVSGVDGAHNLRVEGWWDYNTREQVSAPSQGSTYTLYKIFIGVLAPGGLTKNTITSYFNFYDLDGNVVTPVDGTRFEVLHGKPNYPLHMEYGARKVRIINNTFKRGWADQISCYGDDNHIIGNLIEDGQDVGITINSSVFQKDDAGRILADHSLTGHSLVIGNRIHHQGTWSIYIDGPNCLVSGNLITKSTWTNFINHNLGGIIIASDAENCSIVGNVIDGQNSPRSENGIVINGDDCLVSDNKCFNTSKSGIKVTSYGKASKAPTDVKLRNNVGEIVHEYSAVGGDYGVLEGNDSPEQKIIAGTGTLYRDLTGGHLWIKARGTDNAGWIQIA